MGICYPEDKLIITVGRYSRVMNVADFIYKYFGFEDSKQTLMCRDQLIAKLPQGVSDINNHPQEFSLERFTNELVPRSGILGCYRKVMYGLPRILFDEHF